MDSFTLSALFVAGFTALYVWLCSLLAALQGQSRLAWAALGLLLGPFALLYLLLRRIAADDDPDGDDDGGIAPTRPRPRRPPGTGRRTAPMRPPQAWQHPATPRPVRAGEG